MTQSAQTLAHAAPDWSAMIDEVRCPLCDYNLYSLQEPRCPECGYRFDWADLLSADRRAHPYLFEHHPERKIWSYFKTFLGGLRPGRFWQSLKPSQPSRPRRLAVYAVLTICLIVTVPLASFARYAVETVRENLRQKAAVMRYFQDPNHAYTKYIVTAHGSTQAYLAKQHQPPFSIAMLRRLVSEYTGNWGHVRVLFAILAWPWLTFGALMIFRWSMRRAKVRTVHVLRCALYCCDAGVWLGVGAAFLVPALVANLDWGRYIGFHDRAVAAILFAAGTTWRLWAAYRHYLQFDRPAATAAASQVVVTLFVWVLLYTVISPFPFM